MRKIMIIGALFLIVNLAYSQSISDIDVGKRKEYMMKTYKIHHIKAEKYLEEILPSLERENEQLKHQRISSDKFKEAQKNLYRKYGKTVSQVFSKGRYKTWSFCIQELERYHVLSETKFIPLEKMYVLYRIERAWEKDRDQMLSGDGDEQKKIEDTANMLMELNKQIRQMLGMEIGNWYINYKELMLRALDNMDKYGATYNEGYRIAQIENDCSQQRKKIWEMRSNDRNEKLLETENKKKYEIKKALPTQVVERWEAVNNVYLEYVLTNRYGLNKVQINQFKTLYNSYAIEEYKIINDQKKLSALEKYAKLVRANAIFCQKVRPLFKDSSYKKWKGKRMHDFKQRVDNKSEK